MKVTDLEVIGCDVHADGGFARLRRCSVRNVREDGSRSEVYRLDMLERPVGADAVLVLAHQQREGGGHRVLLRRGLRPAPRLGRAGEATREGEIPPLMNLEVVAGVLEAHDQGDEGLRRRAAEELLEEAGLRVEPAAVHPLGPPVYNSLGIMAERLYFCAVEADLTRLEPPPGDGTPLEEGSTPEVYSLREALSMCERGEIQDGKTELALRRLAARVGNRKPKIKN